MKTSNFLYLNKQQHVRSKMKANHFLLAASMALASSAYAGFYADAGFGLGVGMATESYSGEDFDIGGFYKYLEEEDRVGAGFDLGIKAGGGFPNIGSGLFIVGELSMEFSSYVPFSIMFGPGIILYPMRNLQLGSSVGYSGIIGWEEGGYAGPAYNVSVAYDIGSRSHGLLLGLKYYNCFGDAGAGNIEEIKSSTISVFVKNAFRKKKETLIADEERRELKRQKQAEKKGASIADEEE
jgi:hypothetical protein